MKRKILISILLFPAFYCANAQNQLPPIGDVGINTTSPMARLHISRNNTFSDQGSTSTTIDNMIVLQTPYQGSLPPIYNGTGYKWGIQFWGRNDAQVLNGTKTGAIYAVSEDGQMGYNRAVGLAFHTSEFDKSNVERLRITSTGNVGIGTVDTKGYKLAVAGNVVAESITVKSQSAWPDYVFDQSYKQRSLVELEEFIRKNKHLPEIPKASEVSKNGIELGEMNAKLLKKIEELTLILIEQNKRIDKLEAGKGL